jgi:hypothetical protein
MNLADSAHLALTNLTSVPVLAFVLGVVSTSLLRSPLRLPDSIYRFLSFYLLLAIGVKGGVALSKAHISDVVWPAIAALALGIVIPIGAFVALKLVTRLGVTDRGALAAHYGSTSLVTFTAATALLAATSIPVEGFAPTLLSIMEVPGIVVGLALVGLTRRAKAPAVPVEQRVLVGAGGVGASESVDPASRAADLPSRDHDSDAASWSATMREVLTAPSVLLLVGGLVIGLITGPTGFEKVDPLFNGLFQGLLALFLLHMGAVAGETLSSVRRAGAGLVGFALVFPVVAGTIGVLAGTAVGLSVGGAAILGVLCASASYIAAPAAVSLALPKADRGLCLSASLGMTFPFNLLIGIPLLVALATFVGAR